MHQTTTKQGWGGHRPRLDSSERVRRLEIGRRIAREADATAFTRGGFIARFRTLNGHYSATVADAVLRELVERGEVAQDGAVRTSGRGRPSVLYRPVRA